MNHPTKQQIEDRIGSTIYDYQDAPNRVVFRPLKEVTLPMLQLIAGLFGSDKINITLGEGGERLSSVTFETGWSGYIEVLA